MADAQTLHLVRRATFGPTTALLAQAQRLGRDAWLRRQLAPAGIADTRCDRFVARLPRLGWPIAKIRGSLEFGSWDVMLDLVRATIARAAWSERQLFEVMVNFWSDHLNVTCPSSDVWDSRAHYDRVLRRYALGRFSDLLVAATLHPAMLSYLDNASSTKDAPNENHGRELLELHTVGIDAGYTEQDVRDSARILTGFTVDFWTGATVFRPEHHHTGPVRVLEFTHPNDTADGGRAVAVAYLRRLARHPRTARTIARKLAVRFVADEPPAALVTDLARTYLANDTKVGPVLWQLFRSKHFAAAAGRKTRRPWEDITATLRTLELGPEPSGTDTLAQLHWSVYELGQAPLGRALPDGYPDVALAWQSAAGTLARWNSHLSLAAGWWPKGFSGPGLTALLPRPRPATHGALVDALARRLWHGPAPTAAQLAAVCTFLDVTPATPLRADSPALGWRLPYLVALLLDAPQHTIR